VSEAAVLDAAALLELWDEVRDVPPLQRALVLADTAVDVLPRGVAGAGRPAELPIGQLIGLLLAFRATQFGRWAASVSDCPACDEQTEFETDAAELAALAGTAHARGPGGARWRCPTATDLLAVLEEGAGAGELEAALARRCAVAGAAAEASVAEFSAAVAAADPLVEIVVELRCPACDATFSCELDVVAQIDADLRSHAHRLLAEVDGLARRYGWSERDILGLSRARRSAYLELGEEW
jgi:hypothetical protein